MIHLNIRALVQLTHLFLPEMLARKGGRILNVASVAGFVPGPSMATAAPVALHAYRAMVAGKVVAIPVLMNKLVAQSARVSPRARLRAISARLNSKRK